MPNSNFRSIRAAKFMGLALSLLVTPLMAAAVQPAAQPQAPAAPTAPAAPATPAAPAPADTPARARAAALAAKGNIDITEAWTKASGNATTVPVYLKVSSSKDPDRLISIETAASARIDLRDDTAGGKAAPLTAMDVPGGGTINFAPGGRYFTLVGLKGPLKEGESFLVTMRFDKAGRSSAVVKVLAANATSLPPPNNARRADTTAGVSNQK